VFLCGLWYRDEFVRTPQGWRIQHRYEERSYYPVAEYLGNVLGGARGWRIRSVSHFVERHGLIVIIALGESIASIGVGVVGEPISWPIVAAAVLGLTLSAALWWAYFDVTSLLAERAFAACPLDDRARLARDAYSYLHLPLVAGIVLLALG